MAPFLHSPLLVADPIDAISIADLDKTGESLVEPDRAVTTGKRPPDDESDVAADPEKNEGRVEDEVQSIEAHEQIEDEV